MCREIGEQLYRSYHHHEYGATEKSDSWYRLAGLGAGGYALALAFARSVPKSTLPVFWWGGEIQYGRRTIHWKPLFRRQDPTDL